MHEQKEQDKEEAFGNQSMKYYLIDVSNSNIHT